MYRREGARRAGGCQTILLGIIFIAVGGGLFLYFSSSYFSALHFPKARCTILAKSIITDSSNDPNNSGDTYAPEFTLRVQPNGDMAVYQTKSNYSIVNVSTNDYDQVAGIVNKFAIGRQYQCWYNPQNPSDTILDRSPNLLLMGVGALFALAGLAAFFSGIVRLIRAGLLLGFGLWTLRR